MGWTSIDYREPGMSHAEFFTRELLDSRSMIIDSAFVPSPGESVFYAAVETNSESDGTEVWALVVLTHGRAGAGFSWKAMDETVGPAEDSCPPRILDRLTPTESEWAREWRQRCRDRVAMLERAVPGSTIVFSADYLTPNGPRRRFTAINPARSIFSAEDGEIYRLVGWKSSGFRVAGEKE